MIRTMALLMIVVSTVVIVAETPAGINGHAVARDSSDAIAIDAYSSEPAGPVDCPLIFPANPVAVAPNQPAVQAQSMVGVINALCDVTLDFVGCGFTPTSVTLNCDVNGDGVPELLIPLKDITIVNRLLLQATLPSLPTTPGTAFPLACCGGDASITMTRVFQESDDNVFGPFVQSLTCPVDLGLRAPVVISASPSEGDCTLGQNLLIPGSCFLLADGKPNVTSVFAVEVGNPANVIQSGAVQIINGNLIDAFFKPGPANAGKSFLIFVSGPNGTSRNLTSLPANAPAGCPLGNEQGIAVTFRCRSANPGGSGPGSGSTPSAAVLNSCRVERDDSGSFSLTIVGKGIRSDSTLTIGGASPKKIKFRDADADGTYTRIQVKKKFCEGLPGEIKITSADGNTSSSLICSERCGS